MYVRRRITVLFVLLSLAIILFAGCKKENDGQPIQFEKQEGQRLARINIRDYGSVTFRLFSDSQPDVVDEFTTRCGKGFYDGTPFFDIIDDYLVMGGSESQENSKKTKALENEEYYPFRGALCANLFNDGTCSLDSFFVITIEKEQLENIKELVEHKGFTFSDYIRFGYKTELAKEELDYFFEYGGAPWLYGHTVVFGQAISGLEILDTIIQAHMGDAEAQFIIDSIEYTT